MESLHSKQDMLKPDSLGVDLNLFANTLGFGLTDSDLLNMGSLPLQNSSQECTMKQNETKHKDALEEMKLQSPKLKLEMEMFADLSGFCDDRKPIMDMDFHPAMGELNTPVLELKAPFDYDRHHNGLGLQDVTISGDQYDFGKVKCELPTLSLEDNIDAAEDSLIFKDDISKLISESSNAYNNSVVLSSQRNGMPANTATAYSPNSSDYGSLYISPNDKLNTLYNCGEETLATVSRYSDIFLNNNSIGTTCSNSSVMNNDYGLVLSCDTPEGSCCPSEYSRNSSPECKHNALEEKDKQFNILSYIDSEELKIVEPVLQSLSTPSNTTNSSNDLQSRAQRRKRRNLSMDDDPDDEDYVPPLAQKRIGRRSSYRGKFDDSDDSEYELHKKPAKRGRPPKRAPSCSSEDYSNVGDGRYREMRDKNNEASRKSRMKRKQKEQELEEEADRLSERNVKLNAQVTELEKTVANFRQDLILVMSKK